jgi:uncharacterized protein with HEPN domain
MSSSRIYVHYLQDVLENAEKALAFVRGMSGDDFLQDEKTVFAVIRALEVMGEAAKKDLPVLQPELVKIVEQESKSS